MKTTADTEMVEPPQNSSGDGLLSMAHSSSDFYPKVVELQRRLGASGFVVASTSKAGLQGSHLKVIMANSSHIRDDGAQKLLKDADAQFYSHVKKSACPAFWRSGRDEQSPADIPRPARKIELLDPDLSGLAFPVNLGGRLTGIVIFFSPNIAVTKEMLLDMHSKIFQILRYLLKIEFAGKGKFTAINSRETECLQYAGNGMTSEDIAEHLNLSVHTVNAHLSSATNKLDSVNRIQAIAKAIRLGLIS